MATWNGHCHLAEAVRREGDSGTKVLNFARRFTAQPYGKSVCNTEPVETQKCEVPVLKTFETKILSLKAQVVAVLVQAGF